MDRAELNLLIFIVQVPVKGDRRENKSGSSHKEKVLLKECLSKVEVQKNENKKGEFESVC